MTENPRLTNDVVFSFLMSSEGSEPALKSFVNAALADAGRPLTKSVSILHPFSLKTFQSDKLCVFDVKAQDVEGRYFNIEMQTTNKKGFNNRILFYWSRLNSKQLLEGDKYALLNPAVSIVVARFMMFPQLESMHNVFTLASESNPNVVFSDQIQIHSIELPKADFTKPNSIQKTL
ncbi:MAG: Rpn family recombination-promoting nuclease/putative transposase, partial [Thermoguttaceae bacterium]|nr:Rpn family recombination-promoting nuclease/putative transposase [Thermoguttaceae bacterium]